MDVLKYAWMVFDNKAPIKPSQGDDGGVTIVFLVLDLRCSI
jgi:hypothetical protein